MNEKHQVKYKVDYNKFCEAIKTNVFGFNKIKKDTLNAQYHELSDDVKKANDFSYKMFSEMLGEKGADIFEETIPSEESQKVIDEIIEGFIIKTYEKKSYAVDGVCLREHLLGCAVHMKYDIELLGFISELIEGDTRFLYVDFGGEEGAVKIDIEEIIIAERL